MPEEIFKDYDAVIVECPGCLEDIPTNYQNLGESNELTCGECGIVFIYDVENLKHKINSAMRKILGTSPKDPNLN